MNTIVMSTTNRWLDRQGYTPKWIIIHSTAGGADAIGIANYFISTEGTGNPVSSNVIVGQDGKVVVLVPLECAAYANGILEAGHDLWWSDAINPNLVTISVENCNTSTTNSDPLTSPQEESLFAWIKETCIQWNIPMRRADANGGITGHYSISPLSRHSCPGEGFFWAKLWAYLAEGNKPMTKVPDGWHDEGGVLYRPDRKFKVVHGFRDHILNDLNWQSSNWPIEDEQGVAQLEESNPALGAGTRQLFRMGQLEWTKTRNVFDCWIGNELNALRVEIAALQKAAKPPAK